MTKGTVSTGLRGFGNGAQALSSPPLLVGKYTDCSKQAPPVDPAAEAAWWTAQGGRHRPAAPAVPPQRQRNASNASWKDDSEWKFLGGPIHVPGEPLGICVVPKNGCTYWKALIMRMNGHPNWNSTMEYVRHDPRSNGIVYDRSMLDRGSGMLTAMTVRNPMTRVLSAWKEKSADTKGYYKHWFDQRPAARGSFRNFIATIWGEVKRGADRSEADPHWKRQVDHCLVPDGAVYDLYLKVECRGIWAPSLFHNFKSMLPYTESGWGLDRKQPFIPPTARSSSDPEARRARPTKLRGEAAGHTTQASEVEEVCKSYEDSALFKKVAWLYWADIYRLGYTADVRRLAAVCGFAPPG